MRRSLGGGWDRGWRRPDSFDGAFNFCRVMYRNQPFGAGGGWSADYPSADVNLSIRVAELTKIRVSRTAAGEPNHLVVRPTDDELFACPFVLMAEVGSAYFDASRWMATPGSSTLAQFTVRAVALAG